MLEEGLKLKQFRHQNVLSLIGVCVEATPAPYIVMPFMSNGSLLRYLRQEKMTLVLSGKEDEDIVIRSYCITCIKNVCLN
jgi:serine/threonine protein kinase